MLQDTFSCAKGKIKHGPIAIAQIFLLCIVCLFPIIDKLDWDIEKVLRCADRLHNEGEFSLCIKTTGLQ